MIIRQTLERVNAGDGAAFHEAHAGWCGHNHGRVAVRQTAEQNVRGVIGDEAAFPIHDLPQALASIEKRQAIGGGHRDHAACVILFNAIHTEDMVIFEVARGTSCR